MDVSGGGRLGSDTEWYWKFLSNGRRDEITYRYGNSVHESITTDLHQINMLSAHDFCEG